MVKVDMDDSSCLIKHIHIHIHVVNNLSVCFVSQLRQSKGT